MPVQPLILLLIAISMISVAQILQKQGMSRTGVTGSVSQQGKALVTAMCTPRVLCGLLIYVFASLIYLTVINKVDVSFAFPMMSMGYVLVTVLSAVLLHERVNPHRWLSLLVICLGVVMMALWGHSS